MSNYSFCFSPAGGTKKVEQAFLEAWGEEFIPVDLMKDPEKTRFSSGDLCLVAVPSYGGRVPAPVVTRLETMMGSGARAILVAVFGNRAIDDTLLELSDVLQRAGFRPIAALEAVAQHSLLPQFGAGRPDAEDRKELGEFARQIRRAVESGTLSPELKLPGNRPYRPYKGVPIKPSVSGGCIGCGLCAASCPVGAIPETNYRFTDTRKCISCMGCVAVCPRQVRKVSRLLVGAAGLAMKKTCRDRKPNRLYL